MTEPDLPPTIANSTEDQQDATAKQSTNQHHSALHDEEGSRSTSANGSHPASAGGAPSGMKMKNGITRTIIQTATTGPVPRSSCAEASMRRSPPSPPGRRKPQGRSPRTAVRARCPRPEICEQRIGPAGRAQHRVVHHLGIGVADEAEHQERHGVQARRPMTAASARQRPPQRNAAHRKHAEEDRHQRLAPRRRGPSSRRAKARSARR